MIPFTGLKAIYIGVFNLEEKQKIYKNFTDINFTALSHYTFVDYDLNYFVVFLRSPFLVARKLKLAYLEEHLRFEIFYDSLTETLMPNVLTIIPKGRNYPGMIETMRAEVEENGGRFVDYDFKGHSVFILDSFFEAVALHSSMSKRFRIRFTTKDVYFDIQQKKSMSFEAAESLTDEERNGEDSGSVDCKSEADDLVHSEVNSDTPEPDTLTDSFDYDMFLFPRAKLELPRLPREEPSMKDLSERMEDLNFRRKVKKRAELWNYFANSKK